MVQLLVLLHEDILRIPEVAEKGVITEKKRGNVRLNEYRYSDESGTRYTLVTEVKDNGEVFNDFYTNKKASKQTPQIPEGDTPKGARPNVSDAQSGDKGTTDFSTVQEGGENTTDNSGDTRFSVRGGVAPTFYSNAERAVERVKQEKAKGEQWLAMGDEQRGASEGGEESRLAVRDDKEADKEKATTSERSGAVSGNSSSDGLRQGGSAHLSHGPLTTQSPLDAAKLRQNAETTKRSHGTMRNRGGLRVIRVGFSE